MTLHEVRIVAGGRPDEAEETAIAEAVARVMAERGETGPDRVVSGWTRAARHEAVGLTTVRSRATMPRV